MIRAIVNALRTLVWSLDNARRGLERRRGRYVVLDLRGPFPERTPRPRFLGLRWPWEEQVLSIEAFGEIAERLGADERVAGVVLRLQAAQLSLSKVQSLRDAIGRLRQQGKRVVCYAAQLDTLTYPLATACDEVLIPESAELQVIGLALQATFLRDTLALAGVVADVETIGEYKTAADALRRSEMSPAHREMLDALLDSLYGWIARSVAADRKLEPAAVKEAVDAMPMSAEQARVAGLVDAVLFEDEIGARLGDPGALVRWEQARDWVRRPLRPRAERVVGVVTLQGTIAVGRSRRLPIPVPLVGAIAGSESIVQALRAAERQSRIAAVVLLVDSPGGSALASDLIWREIWRVRQRKPVVVWMGAVAASGGYYVASAANAILAQPATLSGSIGILGGKLVTAGLYDRLHANRTTLSRGEVATIYHDDDPFTPTERERLVRRLEDGYRRFLSRVADGRKVSLAAVDAVGRGRVWTGEQAQAHGLVDQLGDFYTALARARALAGLRPDQWAPAVRVEPGRAPLLPRQPLPTADGAWLTDEIASMLRGAPLALCPWTFDLHG